MKDHLDNNDNKLNKGSNFFTSTLKAGFQVTLPIALFLIAVGLIIDFMVGLLDPFKSVLGISEANGQWLINLIAFLLAASVFLIAGMIVRTKEGNRLIRKMEENYLSHLPMYTGIKDTVEQFSGTTNVPLRQVVALNVFDNSIRMIGFITDELDNGYFSVFVSTGPNPANGFIFLAKRGQMEFLDVKPDAAMRMIIGVGTGASSLFKVKEEILEENR